MAVPGAQSPGALLAVIGPSGAGKDTLIGLAQALLSDEPRIVFPRRVVTRGSGAGEDHETLPPEAFAAAEANGAFVLSWGAHGLRYGIPRSVLDAVCSGSVAVVNLSRSAVPQARQRFPRVVSVYVTAPADVLAARIAARGRDEDLAARIARASAVQPDPDRDIVIENVGDPQDGGRRLAEIARSCMAGAHA